MYTLYIKSTCPFSAKVMKVVADLDITLDEKNVADDGVVDELIAVGGKKQVPCLVDPATDTVVYESDSIITYLMEGVLQNGEKNRE